VVHVARAEAEILLCSAARAKEAGSVTLRRVRRKQALNRCAFQSVQLDCFASAAATSARAALPPG